MYCSLLVQLPLPDCLLLSVAKSIPSAYIQQFSYVVFLHGIPEPLRSLLQPTSDDLSLHQSARTATDTHPSGLLHLPLNPRVRRSAIPTANERSRYQSQSSAKSQSEMQITTSFPIRQFAQPLHDGRGYCVPTTSEDKQSTQGTSESCDNRSRGCLHLSGDQHTSVNAYLSETERAKLKRTFQQLDHDGDGYVQRRICNE